MDKCSTYAGNLVGSNGRANTAAAERDSTLNLPCGDSPGQRNNEVGVVVFGVKLVSTEVDGLVPRTT